MIQELKIMALLSKVLLFPFRWVAWIFWLGQVFLLIFGVAFKSHAVVFIWAISSMVPFIFGVVLLPQSILSLISSRQLGLIDGLKFRIFCLLLLMPLIVAAWVGIISLIESKYTLASMMEAYFLSGIYLIAAIYFRKWVFIFYFTGAFWGKWILTIDKFFTSINPALLFMGGCIAWSFFYL